MSTEDRRQQRVALQRERERQRARKARQRQAFAILGVVVLAFALLVGLRLAGVGTSSKSSKPTGSLDPAVLTAVTTVPPSTLAQVGGGSAKKIGIALPGPDLTQNGKPKLVYVGAEYCPFCAAQRWPVVVALSRFGTWSNLSATTSAADDVYPNTPTFSFHGAGYSSDYLVFEGVETNTNQRVGSSYAPLDTPTQEQLKLLQTYDAPPYVPAQQAGAIPFLDLGNRFMTNGSSFSPDLLSGMTMKQISDELSKPDSPVAQAVLGAANRITAAICQLTQDKPASVCTAAPVPALKAELPRG